MSKKIKIKKKAESTYTPKNDKEKAAFEKMTNTKAEYKEAIREYNILKNGGE